jgi:hypothetical protein
LSEGVSVRRFVREALPLISSYLHSSPVELGPTEISVFDGDDEDEFLAFECFLRMRHAIACAINLKPILEAIERGVSQSSKIVRSESKGTLAGRLDIPLYLSRRGRNLSWPKTFPVLISEATPDTPENRLVREVLRDLIHRLSLNGSINSSAEQAYCLSLLRWSRDRVRSDPWARVSPSQNFGRLRRETEHRLRKRQTGNEIAYQHFLDWLNQWSTNPSQMGSAQSERMVDILLAFPPGDFFGDRVFEIWCLHQTIESLRRAGAVLDSGPRALSDKGRSICEFWYEDYRIEVWFQLPLPSSTARWSYVHPNNQPLRGVPDITLVGGDGRRLLIDAKRREVKTKTRSEETYKMLGYLENFRHSFTSTPFWGVLCFLSEGSLFREITAGKHKIFLIGAHNSDPLICPFEGRLDTVLAEWLSLRPVSSSPATAPTIVN